jgi:hypothetical protein
LIKGINDIEEPITINNGTTQENENTIYKKLIHLIKISTTMNIDSMYFNWNLNFIENEEEKDNFKSNIHIIPSSKIMLNYNDIVVYTIFDDISVIQYLLGYLKNKNVFKGNLFFLCNSKLLDLGISIDHNLELLYSNLFYKLSISLGIKNMINEKNPILNDFIIKSSFINNLISIYSSYYLILKNKQRLLYIIKEKDEEIQKNDNTIQEEEEEEEGEKLKSNNKFSFFTNVLDKSKNIFTNFWNKTQEETNEFIDEEEVNNIPQNIEPEIIENKIENNTKVELVYVEKNEQRKRFFQILKLQKLNGSWEFNDDLLKVLNLNSDFLNVPEKLDKNVWVTSIVVFYLENYLFDFCLEYSFMIEKSKKFISFFNLELKSNENNFEFLF